MKVVVYSHDADTRARIKLAIGRRPAPDVPEAEVIEVATHPALIRLLDAGGADVMVLDGEAQPAGGMGVCRQAKDEVYNCPPVLLIIGRPDQKGSTGRDNRMFVEGVLWIVRTGSPWRDLPEVFGEWNSVFRRFSRLFKSGAAHIHKIFCPCYLFPEVEFHIIF